MDGAFMEPSGRNRWQPGGKWVGTHNRSNKPKPLPWVATGCRRESMVRRGSAVRVRQRALKDLQIPISCLTCPPKRGNFRSRAAAEVEGRVDQHDAGSKVGAFEGNVQCDDRAPAVADDDGGAQREALDQHDRVVGMSAPVARRTIRGAVAPTVVDVIALRPRGRLSLRPPLRPRGIWCAATVARRRLRQRYPPLGRLVPVDGQRVHAYVQGAGRDVVLLHGNPGSVYSFVPDVVDALAGSFRVIAIDRPGHGYSDPAPGDGGSPIVQAHVVRTALRELDVEQPIVVAESWSGSLALAYALEFPGEVAAIVAAAGTFYADDNLIDPIYTLVLAPVVGQLFTTTVGPTLARRKLRAKLAQIFAPAPVPPAFADMATALWTQPSEIRAIARDARARARVVADLSRRYSELRIPITAIVGSRDQFVDQRNQAYRLRPQVPELEIVALPDTGHVIAQTHPDVLAAATGRLASTLTTR
jgi:pimeloyl-ACP methyl ester carboxylesterase